MRDLKALEPRFSNFWWHEAREKVDHYLGNLTINF